MAHSIVVRAAGRTLNRIPGLRRIPVLKLIAAAELAFIAHDHVTRLDRQERRRLFELLRIARGRPGNLTDAQRDELADLVAIMEPRLFVGHAVHKLSPVGLPRRLVYGPRKRH